MPWSQEATTTSRPPTGGCQPASSGPLPAESEDRSRRVRRKQLELAEQGRPAGQLGWGVHSDEERELVREAARRVLEGEGLMTIARDWNTKACRGRLADLGLRPHCAGCCCPLG